MCDIRSEKRSELRTAVSVCCGELLGDTPVTFDDQILRDLTLVFRHRTFFIHFRNLRE
jgi:hypothetical protein